jgi:RnfABCDGE-type electron transport complex G subunit
MIRLTLVLAAVTFVASVVLGFVYQTTKPKIEMTDKLTKENARRVALPEAACGVFTEEESDGLTYFKGYRSPDTTGFVGYVVTAEGKGYSSTIVTVVGLDPYGRITGLRITSQQETPGLGTRIDEVRSTRTVADAIAEMMGRGKPKRVCVYVPADTGKVCIEATLREGESCNAMDKALAEGDTAAVIALMPGAFGLSEADSVRYLSHPASAFALSRAVIEELRLQNTPWFLQQFVGKDAGRLLVRAEKTDEYIEAITGATISSSAVTESVRKAIQALGKAIGGFEEVPK